MVMESKIQMNIFYIHEHWHNDLQSFCCLQCNPHSSVIYPFNDQMSQYLHCKETALKTYIIHATHAAIAACNSINYVHFSVHQHSTHICTVHCEWLLKAYSVELIELPKRTPLLTFHANAVMCVRMNCVIYICVNQLCPKHVPKWYKHWCKK